MTILQPRSQSYFESNPRAKYLQCSGDEVEQTIYKEKNHGNLGLSNDGVWLRSELYT